MLKMAARARAQGGLGEGMKATANTIVWNSDKGKFATPDGLAYLEYKMRTAVGSDGADAKQVMDVIHTYVPAKKRGMGLAGDLCKAAFTHAREHNLLVLPTCTYVSDTFVPRHPEWNDVVVPESLSSNL